jgi:hypothetical protein
MYKGLLMIVLMTELFLHTFKVTSMSTNGLAVAESISVYERLYRQMMD